MSDYDEADEPIMSRCEQFGHIDETIDYEDEYGAQFGCRACGAE